MFFDLSGRIRELEERVTELERLAESSGKTEAAFIEGMANILNYAGAVTKNEG